jgi:hypothetical protein
LKPWIIDKPICHARLLEQGTSTLKDEVSDPLLSDIDIPLSYKESIASYSASIEEVAQAINVRHSAETVKGH